MAKLKTLYFCKECGTEHPKWQGQCKGCGAWNSLIEEVVDAKLQKKITTVVGSQAEPVAIDAIDNITEKRMRTPDREMNRVLGGGIVEGSLVLLGGEPGIGKSTLMLQLALQLAGKKILYVSGEESARQIKMRAERIPFKNPDLFVLSDTSLENVMKQEKQIQPDLLVIDSIQTVYTETVESAPGSVSQVRECAGKLMRFAKETQTPVFLIGHITKEGALAGPKVLEHMVDTVLTFEGDRHHSYRIVRTSKNRFGSTLELGIYEMRGDGLREVRNPSEIFLSPGDERFTGVAISATLEGMRPLLIEVQALVSPQAYGNAQRSATGYDLRRLNMLLAVLEKKSGFKMGIKDVFINVAGGLKVTDPALDLGLVCAIVSSMHDLPIPEKTVFAAEVGLSGELRAVQRLEQRIAEAAKLGFQRIIVAAHQAKDLKGLSGIKVQPFHRIDEVFRAVFSNAT